MRVCVCIAYIQPNTRWLGKSVRILLCLSVRVCNQDSVQCWVNGLTHSLLNRVASLAWLGSGRSRSGWSSSPCALQRLVELERWSHTLSLSQSYTPLTLCLLNMCHTWCRDVWTINCMLDGSTYSTHISHLQSIIVDCEFLAVSSYPAQTNSQHTV